MSRTRSAGLSQLVIVAGFAGHILLGLALTVALGRSLSPSDFGFFALAASFFLFSREISDLGTTTVASREIRRKPESERSLIEGLYAWRQAVGVVLAGLAAGFALTQDDPIRRNIVFALALSALIMGPTAIQSAFLARQAQLLPTLAALLTQIALVASCLALLQYGITGADVVGLVVIREVLLLGCLSGLGIWILKYRPTPGFRGRDLHGFTTAAAIWGLAAACRHVYGQADILAVTLFRSEAEVGALAAALRPLAPVFSLPWLATAPLIPLLALAIKAGQKSHFDLLLRKTLQFATSAGGIAACLGVALAPDLIALMYGGRYLEPALNAAVALQWLALAILPAYWIAVCAMTLLAAGRERCALIIIAAGLAIKIVLNLSLVPIWGFHAAAASTACVETGLAAALYLAAVRPAPRRRPSLRAAAPLAPAGVVAIASFLIEGSPAFRVTAVTTVGLVAGLYSLLAGTGRGYLLALRKTPV
jgi:O-antigen/teichoic acid export membrane protein